MRINTGNAIKLFFSNPSLELVYIESIANAIDAGATLINIKIRLESFSKAETLGITIQDNGDGFNNKNFTKFSQLLEVEEEGHKGIGRLVFLNYFKEVFVSSDYEGNTRVFTFSEKFDGENIIKPAQSQKNKTTLSMQGYRKNKINSYDYLKPLAIKKAILLHFFPLFYSLKMEKKKLIIKILSS